jgi:cell wall-associated NlpC family hydrolase
MPKMSIFDRYVGIPYSDKGRDGALDCWGLLVKVYREQLGIELPSYSDRYVTTADRDALDRLIRGELEEPWRAVAPGDEMGFDAVLMREGRFVRHVGLVTEPGRLLHISPDGICSAIERYRDGLLKNRIAGFYRHSQFRSVQP